MKRAIVTIVIVILVAIFGTQSLYTQDETQLSVTTRFGEIQRVDTTPGLKFKLPFVENKNYFDKRLLRVDLPEASLLDVDKQGLDIDAYVRYRITDARKFFERLGTEVTARERITRIVGSALREEVAQSEREDVIGAVNKDIVTVVTDAENEITLEDALLLERDAALGDTVAVATSSRQELLDNVLNTSQAELVQSDLGISIEDIRIKRADFPPEAQQAIFTRMRAERERLSREFRAEGQRDRDLIEADVNRDVAIILAEAEREANITRGEGEAEAIRILAVALEKDPDFFAFRRSLEAYTNFLSVNSTIILSSDADVFRYLESATPTVDAP